MISFTVISLKFPSIYIYSRMKIVGFPTMMPLVRRIQRILPTLVLERINVDEKEYTANSSHALSNNIRASSVQRRATNNT